MKLSNTIKERKWDYLINFLVMLIGIWVGFYLANISEQKRKDQDTLTSLGYLYNECSSNIGTTGRVYSQLIKRGFIQPLTPTLDRYSSLSLLSDENLTNIVDLELYSLILSYSALTEFINKNLESFNKMLFNNIYSERDKEQMRHFLINRMAKLVAINKEMKNQLRDKGFFQQSTIEVNLRNDERLNELTKHILNGEFTLTNPDGSIYYLPKYNRTIPE